MDGEEKEIRTIITCILTSSPVKMTVRNLGHFFKENEGYDIPYRKFGYQTLTDYLRTLTDKVQVTGYGDNAELTVIVGEKSAHIAQLISKQRINVSNKRKFQRYSNNRPLNYHTSNMRRDFNVYPPSPPRLEYAYSVRPNVPFVLKKPIERNRYIIAEPASPPNRSNLCALTKPNVKTLNTMTEQSKCCQIKVTASTEIEDINSIKTNDESLNAMGNTYEACEQSVKDSMSESCVSAISTPSVKSCHKRMELSEVGNSNKHSLGAIPKSHVSNNLSDSEDELFFSDDEVNTRIPKGVQDNLKKLISKADDGIWCAKLPDLYKREFRTELDYTDYGYRSIAHMCADMGSVFRFVQPNLGDVKLFDIARPIPPDALKFIRRLEYMKIKAGFDDVPQPELLAKPDDTSIDVSFEIFALGKDIPRQWIDPSVKLHDYIDVKIGEVYDPSKFWFCLRVHSLKLDALMDNMQVFYRDNWKVYGVPQLCLKPDLYIAVIYLNEYHRGKVLKVKNIERGKIKVFYIDYGTVATVPVEGICYLHKQFCDLPEQAIRGRLSGIYPPIKDEQWCRNSSKRFLNLVSGKDLVAQVLWIDEKIQALHILLVDTSTSTDFFINDALVNEGYAIYSTEKQKPPICRDIVPIVKYIHLFPTFAELECGLLPNLFHMENLRNAEIEIESIYKHYFIDKEERNTGHSTIDYNYEEDYFEDFNEEYEPYPDVEHSNEEDGQPKYDDNEGNEENQKSESWIELYAQEESELESTIEKLKENKTDSTPAQSSISPIGVGVGSSSFQKSPSPRSPECAREPSPPIVKQFLEDFAKSTAQSESRKISHLKPPPGFDGVVPVPQNGNYVPPNSTHYLQQNVYFPNYVQPNYVQPQFVYPNFGNRGLFVPPDFYSQPHVPYQNVTTNQQFTALLFMLQNLQTHQSNSFNSGVSPPNNNNSSVGSTNKIIITDSKENCHPVTIANKQQSSQENESNSANINKLEGSDSEFSANEVNNSPNTRLLAQNHNSSIGSSRANENVIANEEQNCQPVTNENKMQCSQEKETCLISITTDKLEDPHPEVKFVKLVELAKIPVHIVKNDKEFAFILDEIAQIFLGKSIPINQLRKLSIGMCYPIHISDINLRKAEGLKAELLRLGLINEDTTTLNVLALRYIRQLATILLTKPEKIRKFEHFLKDTMEFSRSWPVT